MTELTPPKGHGPLARREARLAWGLLFPTILSVSLVVVLPLLSIFWISFKPIGLADLRPIVPVVREDLRDKGEATQYVRYRLQNRSQEKPITDVVMTDVLPDGITAGAAPEPCVLDGTDLRCDIGTLEPGARLTLELPVTFAEGFDADVLEDAIEDETEALATGQADNILTNTQFTFENFARIFDDDQFLDVLWATTFYTVVGTIGALVVGLFAA
ncbi:MAG: sugar ABC transporter permease, partial [Pseudomonadota bacterium]